MYAFQIRKGKSYRTVYSGKESQAIIRFVNGSGTRRVVKDKKVLFKKVG